MEINIEEIDLENLGVLENIFYDVDADYSNAITKVFLEFDKKVLVIGVNEEDDSIILSLDDSVENLAPVGVKHLDFELLIESVKCSTVHWLWRLTNQQGYFDGIQIEFINRNCTPSYNATIQFMAMASMIEIRAVEPVARQLIDEK